MLLNYKFENFLSFRENVEFSMVAPKTKVKRRFPNNYITAAQGCDILKTAVIVGENAGGKSNFVRSLEYFRSFFQENKSPDVYRSSINVNSDIDKCGKKCNTLQSFDIDIYLKDIGFYLYHLEIDFAGIVKEELRYRSRYKKKYTQILSVWREDCKFECDEENSQCSGNSPCKTTIWATHNIETPGLGNEIEESLEKAMSAQKKMGLVITKLAILGDDHAINFTEWMRNSLCPETNVINYDLYKSMRSEEEDFRILNDSRFMEIFRLIDPSINEIVLDEEKPFSKSFISRKKEDGSKFLRELSKDSSGVREYFAWAVQIFKVVYEDKIVFADEMDRVLNPILSDYIITFINGKDHRGQFIFTTHNVLHLDLKNYMKEQIYFISKNVESLESELYSLADFPQVRYETTKIYEFYMKGILGGTAIE